MVWTLNGVYGAQEAHEVMVFGAPAPLVLHLTLIIIFAQLPVPSHTDEISLIKMRI
jgi:hypothetical protein